MKWIWLLLGVLAVLLFVGGPGSDSGRISKELWDLGHVTLFTVLVYAVFTLSAVNTRPRHLVWPGTLVLCLLLGLLVEYLQLQVERTFDLLDVMHDVLGGMMGLLLHAVRQHKLKTSARFAAMTGVVLLGLVALRPLTWTIMDDYNMHQAYPVLADFESALELSRWEVNRAQLELSSVRVRHGKQALRLTLLPGEYPGIALLQLMHDWREFDFVRFSVYNSLNNVLRMELKIYDVQHLQTGSSYDDRFNRTLDLAPGWNDIEVVMDDVINAPHARRLNILEVKNLSLFVKNLDAPAVLYIDNLRLSKQ